MSITEALVGVASFLVTGGVGWWAHYVTSGAGKAHRLTTTVMEIQASIEDHEKREERKFDEVGLEARALREAVGELIGSVAELHGKVDVLHTMMAQGAAIDHRGK